MQFYERSRQISPFDFFVPGSLAGRAVRGLGSRAATESLSEIAPRIADDLLHGAAKRVGVELKDLTINNGVGKVKVNFTKGIKHGDVRKLVEFAKSNGANEVVVRTGQVINPKIAAKIEKAIGNGKTFLGGQPKLIREVPSLIPNTPPAKIFEITFK